MAKPFTATKHFRLARQLRKELESKRPGETVDTVTALKSRFNVSQATVTKALAHLQSEGLIHRPAGRSRLIVSDATLRPLHRISLIRSTWPSPDYDAITRALMARGRQRGWAFDVFAIGGTMQQFDLNQAIGDHDAAVLLSSATRMDDSLLASLRRPDRPVVTALEVPEDESITGVSTDDHRVGELAVQHLAELGHENILAIINEPPSRSIFERTMGWRDAMIARGWYRRELSIDCAVRPGQDSLDLTYQCIKQRLAEGLPDFSAVFCVSWTGAMAVMRALREERGWRVPDDVSLVTYAGESRLVPYLDPPLTALQCDMDHYAELIIDQLAERFDDPRADARHDRVKPSLIVRGSTRPI